MAEGGLLMVVSRIFSHASFASKRLTALPQTRLAPKPREAARCHLCLGVYGAADPNLSGDRRTAYRVVVAYFEWCRGLRPTAWRQTCLSIPLFVRIAVRHPLAILGSEYKPQSFLL